MIINIFKELKDKLNIKDITLNTYNSAAKRMNDGLIETFNKLWEAKGRELGSEAYVKAYNKFFDKIWAEELKKISDKITLEDVKKTFSTFKIIIK